MLTRILIGISTVMIPAIYSQAQVQEDTAAIHAYNLNNLPKLLETARSAHHDRCENILEGFQHFTEYVEDDPQLIDTYLFLIEKSTESECIQGTISYLDGAIVGYLGENIKARHNQWKKIGKILNRTVDNPNHQNWRVPYDAAETLEHMGPPYQQKAYNFYSKEIERLAQTKDIADDKREEAMELIRRCLFYGPELELLKGFRKNIRCDIPRESLRVVVTRFSLFLFWEAYIEKISSSYRPKEIEKLSALKHLLEGEK